MLSASFIVYSIGTLFVIGGFLIGFGWPIIYKYAWKKKLQLSPTSETYKLWIKTPIPMYLEIYLFNWTNAAEFLTDKGIKPEFTEIGPFVFKEVHERVNVKWNDNGTVSYNQTRQWVFLPEKSVDLSIQITNLNVVATTVTRMAYKYKNIIKRLVDFLLLFYKEKLIITRSAKQWLFEGMNDSLLSFIKKWTFVSLPYDKFGWFYGRNLSSTYDGSFTINTGQRNIYMMGMVEKWNNVNKTQFFDGECGEVQGSSGELFPPLVESQSNISIFVTDFCGPLSLSYIGETNVEGLNGYHYAGDKNVFDNGTEYPRNKCYCSGECTPSGIRNVTSCRQAPIFISFPHFYLADPTFRNSVAGMRPNKTKHEFYLKIDPLSGIPLEVRAQIQINVLLRPLKLFPMFANVPKVYVPMMWFGQKARVTQELASQGKLLRILEILGLGVACLLTCVGLLLILIRVYLVHFYFKVKNVEPLITSEVDKENETSDESSESER